MLLSAEHSRWMVSVTLEASKLDTDNPAQVTEFLSKFTQLGVSEPGSDGVYTGGETADATYQRFFNARAWKVLHHFGLLEKMHQWYSADIDYVHPEGTALEKWYIAHDMDWVQHCKDYGIVAHRGYAKELVSNFLLMEPNYMWVTYAVWYELTHN